MPSARELILPAAYRTPQASGGRVILGIGAGAIWDMITKLGIPRLGGGAAVRAMAEAITLVRALSGGGDPVTFDGEFYHVSGLDPAAASAPRVFTGSVGPKSLAVTGQLADGWIPPGGSDWLSQLYRESRPRVDAAAVAAGRDPAEIVSVYNFGGRITLEPLAATRGEDGRWIGGSVRQWVDELTTAVLEHHAAGFIYRSPDDNPRRRGPGPLGHRDRPRRPRSDHPLGRPPLTSTRPSSVGCLS